MASDRPDPTTTPGEGRPLTADELETWLTKARGRQIDGMDSRLAATIDALTRERDEAPAKVERLQLHVEMHEERTDAAEERATRAEHANRRLADRYHHLMPNHGTTPLLRDICQCGRDNLTALATENQAMREALTIIGRIHAHPARIARDALASLPPVADERTEG